MSLPVLINQLYEEVIAYEGCAEVLEEEISRRKARAGGRDKSAGDEEDGPRQPRLL